MSDAIAAAVTYVSMWELICMGRRQFRLNQTPRVLNLFGS